MRRLEIPILALLSLTVFVPARGSAQSTPSTLVPAPPAAPTSTPATPSAASAQSAQGKKAAAATQTKPAAKPVAPPQVTAIKVQNYGIYSAASATTDKPAVDGVAFAAVKNVHVRKKTLTVPIGKGVNFGFQYIAVGTPLGERATLHFVVIYPPPGVKKPGSAAPLPRDEYDDKVRIGVKGSFDGYELDNPWEMVPGDWTLQIWSGTTQLASETFTLVKQ